MNEDRTKWINYKGKKIISIDYSNLSGDEMIKYIDYNTEFYTNLDGTDLLTLVDFTDAFGSKTNVEALKKSGSKNKHKMKKTAVLGITGVKKIFLNVINSLINLGAKSFKNEEDALEWLVA